MGCSCGSELRYQGDEAIHAQASTPRVDASVLAS
jgi:hypothetical protein